MRRSRSHAEEHALPSSLLCRTFVMRESQEEAAVAPPAERVEQVFDILADSPRGISLFL